MKSVDLRPISAPPYRPSAAKCGRNDVFSLNWLYTLIFEGLSRTANSLESVDHPKSSAAPKLLFLHASAV